EGSVQVLELVAVSRAFQRWDTQPLNIIADSLYVVGVVKRLHRSLLRHARNEMLFETLRTLWHVLNFRQVPYYICRLKSHTTLPGLLVEGNRRADTLVSAVADKLSSIPGDLAQACMSRDFFHPSARAVKNQFSISPTDAQAILAACPDCAHLPSLQAIGVNPRGLRALQLWQTDVTECSSLGRLRFIHVSIDTYSGLIWATLHISTLARDVRKHWLTCFAVMGVPQEIKTDNSPAYTAASTARFLQARGVTHTFGVPHNSTGQAIVERAHRTLE
ncbi:hypothetical protein N322_04040, partial [Cariama cristata]